MRDDKVCPQTARPLACRRCFYAGANRRSVIRPGKVSSTRRGVAGQRLSAPAKTACGFVRRVASFSAGRRPLKSVRSNKQKCFDAWVCCLPRTPHPRTSGWPEGPPGQLLRGYQADSPACVSAAFDFPVLFVRSLGPPKLSPRLK